MLEQHLAVIDANVVRVCERVENGVLCAETGERRARRLRAVIATPQTAVRANMRAAS